MRAWLNSLNSERPLSNLAQLFSTTVVKELAVAGCSPTARNIVRDIGLSSEISGKYPLSGLFDEIYRYLSGCYRFEYIYKNVIAQKILLEKYTLNSASMLTEVRSGECKADVVIINGTSEAYEIKTRLDNFERLENQLMAYGKVYDKVYVVTCSSQVGKIMSRLKEDIGVVSLDEHLQLQYVRKASSSKCSIDPEVAFDTLRKKEYVSIINTMFGFVPDVSNALLYRECKKLFLQLPQKVAQEQMVLALRDRGKMEGLHEYISSVPSSLCSLALSCELTKKGKERFLDCLRRPVAEVLF